MTFAGVRLKRSQVKYRENPRTSGCTNARIITSRRACTVSNFGSIRARTMYESATQKVPPSIRYGTMRSPGRKIPRPKRKIVSANHSMLLRYAATSDCGAG